MPVSTGKWKEEQLEWKRNDRFLLTFQRFLQEFQREVHVVFPMNFSGKSQEFHMQIIGNFLGL